VRVMNSPRKSDREEEAYSLQWRTPMFELFQYSVENQHEMGVRTQQVLSLHKIRSCTLQRITSSPPLRDLQTSGKWKRPEGEHDTNVSGIMSGPLQVKYEEESGRKEINVHRPHREQRDVKILNCSECILSAFSVPRARAITRSCMRHARHRATGARKRPPCT